MKSDWYDLTPKYFIMRKWSLLILVLVGFQFNSQAQNKSNEENKMETAILANGCFWCTEAIFQRLDGVESVRSGYTGGHVINPAYREVTSGRTGHAEGIEIVFDPEVISFTEVLEVFFSTHDPTTLNRQGADVGTQYRSGIFYKSETQKLIAEAFIKALDDAKVFKNPIVTEVTEFKNFFVAEDYHQNYYNNNKSQPYCRAVINPKLEKFLKDHKDKLKKS